MRAPIAAVHEDDDDDTGDADDDDDSFGVGEDDERDAETKGGRSGNRGRGSLGGPWVAGDSSFSIIGRAVSTPDHTNPRV